MTQVLAPLAGRVLPLAEVPDPVFAAAVVGAGVAIDPCEGRATVVAPVPGRLVKLHPHAFAVLTADGSGVLVHLGIDTVRMAGDGFTLHVEEGAQVATGDAIVSWDPAHVQATGRSPVCPVVALDTRPEQISEVARSGPVEVGGPLFRTGTVEGDRRPRMR